MKFSFEFLYSFGPTHARKIETEMNLTAFNNIVLWVETISGAWSGDWIFRGATVLQGTWGLTFPSGVQGRRPGRGPH